MEKVEIELIDNGWTIYLAHKSEGSDEGHQVGMFIADADVSENWTKECAGRAFRLVSEKMGK